MEIVYCSIPELLFLDMLCIEVEVELVKIVDATAELLPALVVGAQQVLVPGLPHLQHTKLSQFTDPQNERKKLSAKILLEIKIQSAIQSYVNLGACIFLPA